MSVGDDRVGPLDPRAELARHARHAREQTERTVDVHPRAVATRQLGELGHRVEVARVHLAGGRDQQRGRAVEPSELAFEPAEVGSPGGVRGDALDRVTTDPEHRQRLHAAGVDVARAQHPQRRQPREPVGVDVATVLEPPTIAGRRRAR